MPALLVELIFDLGCGAATAAVQAATLTNRFAVGFLVGVLDPPLAFWLAGLLLALALGLDEGVEPRRWAPLLGLGVVSGGVLGLPAGI